MPDRMRLFRRAGFRLPANVVNVARPTRWGNPFRVAGAYGGGEAELANGMIYVAFGRWTAHDVTALHRAWITGAPVVCPHSGEDLGVQGLKTPPPLGEIRAALAGRNLGCWCRPDAPCHADVLLELANAPADEGAPF